METFWHIALSGTLLMAAVQIFRCISYHKLPKRVFVLMWCIILARLLIPYSIPVNWESAGGITGPLAASLLPEGLGTNGATLDEDAGSHTAAGKALNHWLAQDKREGNDEKRWLHYTFYNAALRKALTVVWFATGAVMAALILLNHLKWLKRYQTSLPAEGHIIEIWQNYHRGIRTIQIRHSDQITAPLTYGLLRPVILLPSDLRWENRIELLCILEHERLHIKYFDICIKYAMCLALCVYWFHPLVWLMYALLSRDMEAACDEEVLHRFPSVTKSDYALLLLKLTNQQSGDTALGAGFSNYGEMKERITSIMKAKKYTKPTAFIAVLMLLVMSCAFTVSVKLKPDTKQVDFQQPELQQTYDPLSESSLPGFQDHGSTEPYTSAKEPEGVTGEQIAELAKLYVGSPYTYGGTDLETGVDSSGFIQAIFKLKGVSLPRSNVELAKAGTPVEREQLLAGDLIIYGEVNQDQSISPNHSAIYLGDGNVIHASNVREGVKISEIGYRETFSAYRIIPKENQ